LKTKYFLILKKRSSFQQSWRPTLFGLGLASVADVAVGQDGRLLRRRNLQERKEAVNRYYYLLNIFGEKFGEKKWHF
jgi:hypothetical protein